jgi:peptidoglycan/LPS O-acetylase OafA/YrhL
MQFDGNLRSVRRHDFDWLRIGALGLLILTHTAYVYRTIGWRVSSEHAGLWGDLLIEAMAPWRISIVFFIGGAATRFMLEKHDFIAFVQNRLMRLIVPFIMALIVIVPTMLYITEPHLRGANYLDFLVHAGIRNHEVFGVWVPGFAHVWFLPYVFLYALVAGLAWRHARAAFELINRRIQNLPVWALLGGLAVMFVIADAALKPVFGRSNMLVDDPASHVRNLPVFVLGLMVARPSVFWTRLRRATPQLVAATLLLLILVFGLATMQFIAPETPGIARWTGLADGAYGATAMFLILALASRLLGKPGPGLDYFGDAIMPIYLMHQPVIVFVAQALRGSGAPLWMEFSLIGGLAAGFPLFIYHFLVRPTPVLRLLFGLKANPRARKPEPAAPPAIATDPLTPS